jgi:cytochrome P450
MNSYSIIDNMSQGTKFCIAKSHFWVDMILNSIFAATIFDIYRRLPLLKYTSLVYSPVPKSFLAQRKEHFKLSMQKVHSRLSRANDRNDFFSHVISDKKNPPTEQFLLSQASTFIVAGSETTTTLLSGLTYYLLKNPEVLRNLQEEIRGAFQNADSIDNDTASKLPYLLAVIEEGLRIFPPVSFGPPRVSPGATVDGHYVPVGVSPPTQLHVAMCLRRLHLKQRR